MKKGNLVSVVVVAILLLGAGAFALARNSTSEPVATDSTTKTSTPDDSDETAATDTAPTTSTDTTPSTEQTSAATITYSNSGFGPATVTIKSGGKVTVKNTSSRTIDFNSDPHPAHSDNSELNIGTVSADSSRTFTVTKTGTWGYHDHIDPTQTGNVVVE